MCILDVNFLLYKLFVGVCLVESESSRNTAAIGRLNADGSTDYGLFQINSRYWCGIGYRAGGCSMDCNRKFIIQFRMSLHM